MDCPGNWEYEIVTGARETVKLRCVPLLKRLAADEIDTHSEACDTRATHGALFEGLTPPGFPLYAGCYRGDGRCRCLAHYRVTVPSDPRVGYPPDEVATAMGDFVQRVKFSLGLLDQAQAFRAPAEEKLYAVLAVVCALFEELLRIHPYANGNGHIGRWFVCVVFARYGKLAKRWTVEPKPPDPPYSQLIFEARNGNREPLERFVLALLT